MHSVSVFALTGEKARLYKARLYSGRWYSRIDINQNKNIRSTLLRGLSNSRFAVYHHIIRRETKDSLESFFESPWCAALDKAYQSKLSNKRMFVNEQYITIVRRPAQSKISLMGELSRFLFSKVDRELADHYEKLSHTALNEAAAYRGAEIYLRAIGANYTIVSRGRKTGLNPLQLSDTAENRAFIKEWLKLLVRIDNKVSLTPEDNQIITDAVNATYELPIEHRRLSVLSELLRGHERQHGTSLAMRMAMWHGDGERAWLFDNYEDTLELKNRTIGFDLTSILDDPTSRTPWLMYIFYRIHGLLDGSKVMILLDEGWKLLDDPEFSLRIKDWLKTIRKQNGMVGLQQRLQTH
jgi:type IV secretory pathway VirB4 component